MENFEKHIRHILFYYFKKEKKATEAREKPFLWKLLSTSIKLKSKVDEQNQSNTSTTERI